MKVININLVDNRRYYLEDNKVDSACEECYLPSKEFNLIVEYVENKSNPLTLKDFDNIQLLNNSKENMDILKVVVKDKLKYIQTGNMVGKFYFKTYNRNKKAALHSINIGLRFDNPTETTKLEFLLDYANSIYSESINIGSNDFKSKRSNKIIEVLLTKMFINSVSKAIVMGLPTVYQEEADNSYNFKGRIDVNQFISKEIPFKGKMPHIKNEKVVVRSIASVMLKAIDIIYFNKIEDINSQFKTQRKKDKNKKTIRKEMAKLSGLLKIRNTINQSCKPQVLTKQVINEALTHDILKHPSFYEYKNTVYFASLILNGFKEVKLNNIKGESFGYLVDISKIWENFLIKLIEQNISEKWEVLPEPELKLFGNRPNLFELTNLMYPDIVLLNESEKKVMVFDAKFKSSLWFNREDFYKTATYISYYQNHTEKYNVVLCGQIYPDIYADKINENLGFLDSDTDFRVLGIDIIKEIKSKNLHSCKFIQVLKGK